MKISCSPLRWIVRILPLALSVMLMACGGSSTSSSSGGGDAGASGTVIEFVSNSRDQLILQGQGGSETALVTFQVSNTLGEPLLGETVNFSLSSNVGGVSLASSASVETDGSGQASVVVQSGTVATTVHVIASVNGVEAVSSDLAISTGTFIADNFPLTVIIDSATDTIGGSGYILAEGAGELQGISIDLQLIAADQFGHKVRDGARVTLISPETGLIEPSTCVMTGGVCQATWTSTESGRVGDVVTIMAYASGAEAFDDVDSDNVYDPGESFTDLGEAFVDENESGTYDSGERFIDENSNGIYDSMGNGVWDGPCITNGVCQGDNSKIIFDSVSVELGACTPDACGS